MTRTTRSSTYFTNSFLLILHEGICRSMLDGAHRTTGALVAIIRCNSAYPARSYSLIWQNVRKTLLESFTVLSRSDVLRHAQTRPVHGGRTVHHSLRLSRVLGPHHCGQRATSPAV